MRKRQSLMARVGLAALAVAVIAVVAGCGNSSSESSASGASAQRGGILHISVPMDPLTLAPASALEESSLEVMSQVSETLFRVNTEGKLIPQLGTSLKVSPDGLTNTVQIRQGVHFSNGKPLTSRDVAFSLEAARHSLYYESLYEPISKVEAASPSTVVITTKEPMPALKADLAIFTAGIVPDHYGGVSEKEFGQHPIGTGPFQFKSWVHGESVALSRNPHYWRAGEPLLNGVVFQVVPDDNSRISQLQGGASNMIMKPPYPRLQSIEATPGLGVTTTPLSVVTMILLNVKNPLFQDPRIREAINIAIDRKGIDAAALSGRGEPGGSYLAPNLAPFWDESIKPPARDLTKAKALVAAAVKQDGVSPTFTLLSWAGESYEDAASQIIQQDLGEVGLNVKLQALDLSALLASVEGSEFDAAIDGYYSVSPDPSENVAYYLGSFAEPSGVDTKQYSELAHSAATELDPSKRRELYFQLQELVAEQGNAVIIGYQPNLWAQQDSVAGVELSPLNVIWLAKAGFTS